MLKSETEKSQLAFKKELNEWLEQNNPNWKEDPAVQKWLSTLKTDANIHNCLKGFRVWLGWLGKVKGITLSPSEIIEKRKHDLQSMDSQERSYFEDLVLSFRDDLARRSYRRNTIITLISRTQSFFRHHRLALVFARKELEPELTPEVKAEMNIEANIEPPSNIEVRTLYRIGTPRERALILALYHTGLSPIDVSMLTIERIAKIEGKETIDDSFDTSSHIPLRGHREKTNVQYSTFLSTECLEDIKLYLKSREYPREGYIFVSERRSGYLEEKFINRIIHDLAAKALGPERGKQILAKSFRRSFHAALSQANIEQRNQDALMGHKSLGARSSYPTGELLESYEKAFKYLTINSDRREREDIQRMKDELIQVSRELKDYKDRELKAKEKLRQSYREMGLTEDQIETKINQDIFSCLVDLDLNTRSAVVSEGLDISHKDLIKEIEILKRELDLLKKRKS